MYNIFFAHLCRYKAKGQFFDAVELAADGARVLLEAQQGGSGSDVFLMLVNVLETARAEASDEQIGSRKSAMSSL